MKSRKSSTNWRRKRRIQKYKFLVRKYVNYSLKVCIVGVLLLFLTGGIQSYVFGSTLTTNDSKIDFKPTEIDQEQIGQVQGISFEIEQVELEIQPVQEVIEEPKKEECDLTFWTNKDGGHMETPPAEYVERIKNFSCIEQKWLSRLAHYESQYNPNAKNGYFEGLYQIGSGDTRNFCRNNGRNASDEDCALYLVGWLNQMPLMFESHYKNKNSFEDLN
ncbi:MAG: hypothetical protein ACP5NS_04995 [Candidatus Pacearchaeota archaeon]